MASQGVETADERRAWAEAHFGDIDLGDVRRADRAVAIAQAIAEKPGASMPQRFAHPYDVKAAYAFFRLPEATPDALQAAHRERTLEQMQEPGLTLLIEDTSDFSWSGKRPIAGLGPISDGASTDGGLQGFMLHTTIACRWPEEVSAPSTGLERRPPVDVLGICEQLYFTRVPQPGDRGTPSFVRKRRARESEVWQRAGERIGEAPAAEGVRWRRVCDRGADIWEQFVSCRALGHGFLIRAAQDRAVLDPDTGRPAGLLFTAAYEGKKLGGFAIGLRARGNRPARIAQVVVRVRRVAVRPPFRPGSAAAAEPIVCTVLHVYEPNPGWGVKEPISWYLLCDEAVETLEEAIACTLQYASRWLIEEFHRVLKSGVGAQRLQLETAHALWAAIAIGSVVAMRLLDLRERVRLMPDAVAEEAGLSEEELEVLRARSLKPVTTVREVGLAIGRMGGHMNRKGDGMPGAETLRRGLETLNLLVEGVRIARKLDKFG